MMHAMNFAELALGPVVRVTGSGHVRMRAGVWRGSTAIFAKEVSLARAEREVSHWDSYDYVLVNDDVEECFESVRTILAAERLKRSRQTGLIGFVRGLMK